MNPLELAARLRTLLPPNAILHDTEDLRPYECDGLSAYRQLPMIVALPQSEEEVVEVLRICHASKTPVVARGAGTGLSGGALPHPEGVLLSLAKLKHILKIDSAARTAQVQPGVRIWPSARRQHLTACITRRSFLANRLLHRRKCSGKLGRSTLP